MKKLNILTLSLVVVSLLFFYPVLSLAAGTWTHSGPQGDTSTKVANSALADFITSQNVTLVASSNASTYAAVASHLNGEQVYGIAANVSTIWHQTKEAGTAYTTAPTSSDSGAFSSGWDEL